MRYLRLEEGGCELYSKALCVVEAPAQVYYVLGRCPPRFACAKNSGPLDGSWMGSCMCKAVQCHLPPVFGHGAR